MIVKKRKKSWRYETIIHEELDSILRDAVVGGRTQVFQDEIFGSMLSCDANSHYPSVELDERNSWPDFSKLNAVSFDGFDLDGIEKMEGGIYVHWLKPDSDKFGFVSIRNKKTNTLNWTQHEGERWMTLCEFRFLKTLGYALTPLPYKWNMKRSKINIETEEIEYEEIEKIIVAIVCPQLKINPFEAVRKWYNKRLELKKLDNEKEQLVKLLCNAGSFGKWIELNFDQRISTNIIWENNFAPHGWEFDRVVEYNDEVYGYVKDPVAKRAKNTANILGAYVLSYARIRLYEMFVHVGVDNLIYCDTDSVKYLDNNVIFPKEILGENLGQWTIEHRYDFFQAIKPKQYKCHIIEQEDRATGNLVSCDIWKIRIKGVNVKGVVLLLWRKQHKTGQPTSSFTHEILRDLDLKHIMEYERLIGLKESFRRNIDAGKWTVQSKKMR